MSTTTTTTAAPAHDKADEAPAKAELPPFIREAVEEQQRRVWALRSLIECYQKATEEGDCSDAFAAGDGLLELADSIHSALDQQKVAERGLEIESELQWARERKAAHSSGLVRRLRAFPGGVGVEPLCREAADEIERLLGTPDTEDAS